VHSIGIDIGGTKIAGAVVDEFGTIVREDRQPTTAGQPEEIENAVVEMIERLSDGPEDVVAAGVAAAGFIDAAQSIVYYAPNINWRHEPFREKLESRLEPKSATCGSSREGCRADAVPTAASNSTVPVARSNASPASSPTRAG
jgi:predicted NBD/HSP70 family sugar kinase